MFHSNTGTFTTCIMSDFSPPYSILFQLTIFKEKSELWLTILISGSTNGLQNTVWKTVKYVITNNLYSAYFLLYTWSQEIRTQHLI